MKELFDRLYVMTEVPDVATWANAIRRRETVSVSVQKYVAVGDGPFRQAWTEPAQCTLKPGEIGNDQVRSENCELVNLMARVIDVSTTRPEPEMDGFAGARELLGLCVNAYYDCEHEVGLIIDGHNGMSRKPVIPQVKLNVVLNDDELVNREMMKLRGIPEELWESLELLSEMD